VCAGLGGELFVRGAVGIARVARVSPGIIGATVAAFATSTPELSVAITSAIAGRPEISLGDALGSNVVNVALILGCALAISGIQTPRAGLKREFPVALLVPVVTGVLLLDGLLSRTDGLVMLTGFLLWLVATVIEARRERTAAAEVLGAEPAWRAATAASFGLVLLIAAGYLVVQGARSIATVFGIDDFVVGATVVAVGTSLPELATTVIAKMRGHDEVALGTILGSNIFNGLFVVAVAAVIRPIVVDWRSVFVALAFGLVVMVSSYPNREGYIERRRGVVLLALYGAYVATVLQRVGM
jgi:cation:H+ antiporter